MSSPQQPESSDHSEPNRRRADFGPNEWLVDEIYQQYLADSASVDPAWWDFFADYLPTEHAGADVVAAATAARVAARAESDAAEAAQDAEIAAHDSPQPLVTTSTPAQAAPVSTAPAAVPVAQVAATPAAVVPTPIKGGSARVVANMESSLGVPTATSVRAIPAKLLIDNRIVVNNHLARGRGGKVSFTHLIGWAIVQALTSMPEMNWAFQPALYSLSLTSSK